MKATRLTVFLDTNIYLHCTFFSDTPWKRILDAKEIVIAVPPITLSEIDRQKYAGASSRVKERDLNTTDLSDQYRLKEDDANEKKIKRLEEHIRDLESSIPQLCFQFADGSDRLQITAIANVYSESEYIERQMNTVRRTYPERKRPTRESFDPAKGLTNAFISSLWHDVMNDPDPADLARYNQELPTFYDNYEKYLKRKYKNEELLARSIKLEIQISNVGTAPAEDIGVFIKLDSELNITVDDKMFVQPKKPDPPREPRSQILDVWLRPSVERGLVSTNCPKCFEHSAVTKHIMGWLN